MYAETLREEIRAGRMTLDQALDFMLEFGVHPRIATRLLATAWDEEKDLTEDTDAV